MAFISYDPYGEAAGIANAGRSISSAIVQSPLIKGRMMDQALRNALMMGQIENMPLEADRTRAMTEGTRAGTLRSQAATELLQRQLESVPLEERETKSRIRENRAQKRLLKGQRAQVQQETSDATQLSELAPIVAQMLMQGQANTPGAQTGMALPQPPTSGGQQAALIEFLLRSASGASDAAKGLQTEAATAGSGIRTDPRVALASLLGEPVTRNVPPGNALVNTMTGEQVAQNPQAASPNFLPTLLGLSREGLDVAASPQAQGLTQDLMPLIQQLIAGQTGTNAPAAGPVRIANDAEYDKLPSGTTFIGPDGQQRTKP